MVKLVVCSVLLMLVAMQRPINAFGIVRVDVRKDPGYINAINSIVSSKLSFWNGLFAAKTVQPVSTASYSSYPLFTKTVRVNSYAPATTQVAAVVDTKKDVAVAAAPAAAVVTAAPATAVVATAPIAKIVVSANKFAIPAVSVSTTSAVPAESSGTATVVASAPVSYTYSKSVTSN